MMRWYIEPVAADQRAFNSSMLALADSLADSLNQRIETVRHEASARMDELARAESETSATATRLSTVAAEHDDRLVRIERRPAAPAPRQPAALTPPPEPASHPFDYFAFESRMRGPRELIRDRQREYVDDFREAAPVLDVGCGRGEFLALLGEAGIEATWRRPRPRHGRVLPRPGPRRRAGRRARLSQRPRRGVARRDLRRPVRRASGAGPADLVHLARGLAPASRGRHGARDDQPALALRAAQLLRRPDARAAPDPGRRSRCS